MEHFSCVAYVALLGAHFGSFFNAPQHRAAERDGVAPHTILIGGRARRWPVLSLRRVHAEEHGALIGPFLWFSASACRGRLCARFRFQSVILSLTG